MIASALAVPDPRERPLERQQAADQAHLRFRDERSDFLSLVALWEFFADALGRKMGHRRLVDACRAQFVSFLRLREWRDVHQQLTAVLEDAGWKWSSALPKAIDAPRYATLHKAVLAGLLGNIGMKSETEDAYLGARGLKFHLHPGSGLARKGGKWILAAELTETSRLFARCAAKIEPDWIEEVAGERVTRDYFEPHWDEKRGEVVASERVSLYGLTLVARRPVSYGAIDAKAARDVFLREALVPGALATKGEFLAHNLALVRDVAELEHKARRQDVLVDEDAIAAFYAQRVPAQVHSRVSFERWREEAEAALPRLLFLTRDELMRHAAAQVTAELFPDHLMMAGATLPLKYRFAPGHPLDGLTLTVPLAMLNQMDGAVLTWLVPGMIREKVLFLLKSLPKAMRNRLIPLPESVTAFLEAVQPGSTSLQSALETYLGARFGTPLPPDVWGNMELPPHLTVNVVVTDAGGAELGSGRDLAALRAQLGDAARMSFAAEGPAFERKGLRSWDFGDLPETLTMARGGRRLTGYPALVDDGDSVSLGLLDTREHADRATRQGLLRLIGLALKDPLARLDKPGPGFAQASLQLKTAIPTDRLLADVIASICDRAFLGDDPLPRSEKTFAEQVRRARTRLPAVTESAFRLLGAIAGAHVALTQHLNRLPGTLARLAGEVRAQRDALVHPGFFAATPWSRLNHLPRYLGALDLRLTKYALRPDRDLKHAGDVASLWQRYAERAERNRLAGRVEPALEEFRWLVEELRVSLFAQELKTPVPVSFKRLERAWADLAR